jgi:outer membrane protein assembly factor BamB
VQQLSVKWSVPTAGYPYTSPAVVDGVVYLASDGPIPGNSSYVYAFDAATGGLLWSHREYGHGTSAVAVSGGLVYVGTEDAAVYAYDAATGVEVWRFAADSAM